MMVLFLLVFGELGCWVAGAGSVVVQVRNVGSVTNQLPPARTLLPNMHRQKL